jgi:spore maturation protein B
MTADLFDLLEGFSQWSIIATILVIVVWAAVKRVPMYESFITGAKEGFGIAVMIIPYLVAMLLVVKVFMASGIFADITTGCTAALRSVGLDGHAETLDLLPLAFVRPLTGSGSKAVLLDIFDTHGADSFIGNTASIMMGSSETTFYIIMIYFGSVQIKKIRHTLTACLLSDLVGVVMAVVLGYSLFGGR